MLKARKANRVVRIDETKADEYRAEGYTILDMNGNVLLTPNSDKYRIKELEQENARLLDKLAKMSGSIYELKQENAQLQEQLAAVSPKTEGKKAVKETK